MSSALISVHLWPHAQHVNTGTMTAIRLPLCSVCIISFSSDWLYPTIENKEIVIALNACGANVRFVEINSDKGHDSFLLDVPEFLRTVSEFISSTYNEIKKWKKNFKQYLK